MNPVLKTLIEIIKSAPVPKGINKERDSISKSPNQLVTEYDVAVEKYLISALHDLMPEAGFITEEHQIEQNANKEFVWVIDPIDGTTNFIHGIPVFCISVGLLQNNVPLLGVVYEINQDELFSAEKGKGAFLNGVPIHVSQRNNLSDSLIATGFPYYDYERIDKYLHALKSFMKETRGVRRLGSAAADLAYVACGRFDAFFEYSLSPWDVAAGILLVEEAGGKVSGFNANTNPLSGKEIIASSTALYNEIRNIIISCNL